MCGGFAGTERRPNFFSSSPPAQFPSVIFQKWRDFARTQTEPGEEEMKMRGLRRNSSTCPL